MLDNEPNDTNTPDTPTTGTSDSPLSGTDSGEASASDVTGAAAEAPKKAPRRRATKAAAAPVAEALAADPTAGADAPDVDAAEAAPKKAVKKAPAKKAAPRKRTVKAASDAAPTDDGRTLDETPTGVADLDPELDPELDADQTAASLAAAFADPASPAGDELTTARRRSRAPAVVVTFQAPDAGAAPARASRGGQKAPAGGSDGGTDGSTDAGSPAPRQRRRAGTAGTVRPAELLATDEDLAATSAEPGEGEESEDEDGTGNGPRRRRRGRRGRGGRPQGEAGELGTDDDPTDPTDQNGPTEDDEDDEDGVAAGTRRRRRRRRSSGGGGQGGGDGDEDDVPTVVHVREPGSGSGNSGGQQRQRQRPQRDRDGGGAADEDGVRGIAGSTRMAAKRVRRQEGRDSGRKRPPILTEAEFLARREAVDRQMVVRQKGDRTQIAVLEDGILVEHYVTKASATSYAGNVYLGRVQNVLPSMEAAFVDVGKGRNAVLYAGEVNWDGVSGGSRKIEQALSAGQEVLVQVSKDPIGQKGARLTSQINLPGRYLVYVPDSNMTGISRKLPENERTRLKNILRNVVPEEAGVIIRTAAEGVSEQEIAKDVGRLQAQWEVISTKAKQGGGPKLLHAEPDLVIKVVRDIFNEDFTGLTVQGDSEWDTIREYVEFVAPDLAPRLKRFAGNGDVFAEYRIDEQLLKALDRKVYLPSGGSLVIDRTEAMIVVDVNTGKYVGKGGNLEETVTRNNLEAAEEIARQLRLRDLGGIIVVDFIDMVLESNRDLVVRRLVECLGRDRTKHQVAEVTSLGLVQMTRKRVGQGLLESFSETCEACNGRGVKVHLDPVSGGGGGGGGGDRDRRPGVGPRPPKPGPQGPSSVAVEDDGTSPPDGSSGGGSRSRRRRGGRGSGSATLQPENELAELLAEEPEADVAEPAVEEHTAGLPEQTPEPAEELTVPEAAVVPAEPDGPKKRRRAVSRPAGPPAG